MSVDDRAEADYGHARRKAFWRQIGSFLIGRSNDLFPFDEVRQRLHASTQHYSGFREVPIASIVGSVGRYRDFDRAYLPREEKNKSRWVNIDRTYYESITLPPVELYKLGETYFVKDGNHRVSVAREQGQEFIDAYVIEVDVPVSIRSAADLEAWIRRQDELAFVAATRINLLRPDARIELTLPGQYEKLVKHIEVHRWYLGIERGGEVPYEEAVTSWYDNVYAPLIQIIRNSGALREFPQRTEADLYLWIAEHRWYLTQSGALPESHPLDEIVRGYAVEYSERPVRRIARVARRGARRLASKIDGPFGSDGPAPGLPS